MKMLIKGILTGIAASTLLPFATWSQGTTPSIRPGETVRGVLSAKDPRFTDKRPFRVYQFEADSGKRYAIRLHSSDFDAYLRVGKMIGGVTDYVGYDDDSGGGTDALLRFSPTGSGPYAVIVTSALDTAGKGGAFTLELSALPTRLPGNRVIAIGDSATGSLGEDSPTWQATSFPYDLYVFHARKGQPLTVRFRMNRVGTAPVRADVSVGKLEKGAFVSLTSSRSTALFRHFTPPEDGEYTIKVVATAPVSYVLHMDERRPDQPRVVALGKALTDLLDPKVAGETVPYHDWTFSARDGERLSISLRSSDFDTYLTLNRLEGNSVTRIAANDDAPGAGHNSRMEATIPAAGAYAIRVQSADSAGGEYSLRVDTVARVEQHLRRNRILAGQEVSSTLAATDSTLDDGSSYQEWVYRAKAAKERVMFTMRSSAFDTFLSVGRMEGGKFVEFSSNDDAPEDSRANHVSRVLIVAPAAGDLVIRANSTAAYETGAYTLRAALAEVEERGLKATFMALRADTLARQGRVAEAIAKMDSALAVDSTRVTNFNLNTVCWFGALRSFATQVLRYCERAVRLDPSRTSIADSRGVARALSGNVPGAVQDFRAYTADTGNDAASRTQRRAWAEALQAGTPPAQVFSEAVRAELLKQ